MTDLKLSQETILQRLRSDSDYYGEFGQQFLSNSNIFTLINNPEGFGVPTEKTVPMVIGGYFHTLILEPHKIDSFKIIEATTRNTKLYKELSDGEICLLEHEADKIEKMREKIMNNDLIKGLITGDNVEYEVPGIQEIHGEMWKGKADIINHDEKLIIDLKTTGDIDKFQFSAKKFNYDSQAYLYQELFGYEMVFVAIDKKTLQLGIYDCSNTFLEKGRDKVVEAIAQYRLIKDGGFDPSQYITNKTL